MNKINVKTPAKINLVLEILYKRPDGFHEIRSVMQAVSLYDYLTITVKPGDSSINLSGNSELIPYDENNIVYRAAKLFFEKASLNDQQVNIYIEKNIPIAAGLAGGSSDAAGALRGLSELYDYPLSKTELHDIAAQLGSDVNFCLEGGTCIATGRGEKIEHVETPDLKLVLIKPKPLFISAKEAYQRYANLNHKPMRNNASYFNALEAAIIPAYPEIEKIKKLLLDSGCRHAMMSGSGPTVFGIYEGDIDVSGVPEGYEVFKAHSVNSVN